MIRKPNLREWFLTYQLNHIEKNHAHLTFILKIRMNKLTENFGEKIPLTTILVKACSLWQKDCAIARKQVFKTILGQKIYENLDGNVNIPILLDYKGAPYMSVMTVKSARNKSLSKIQQEFKDYSKNKPEELFIGSKLLGKKNNIINRFRLKLIHFVVNNFPSIQAKYGVGTVSVSSLLKFEKAHVNLLTTAKGPGAFSLCVSSFDKENQILELGISWDHQTGDGHEGNQACQRLAEILQGDDSEAFKNLIN